MFLTSFQLSRIADLVSSPNLTWSASCWNKIVSLWGVHWNTFENLKYKQNQLKDETAFLFFFHEPEQN